MLNERYELPPREEIEELVRRARVVTMAREADPVEFLAAAAVLLAEMVSREGIARSGSRALAIATLAIAARNLKAQLEASATL